MVVFLQNKEFVYRGQELEKLASFQQRLQAEFPAATFLSSNNPPGEATRKAEAQCILLLKFILYSHALLDWDQATIQAYIHDVVFQLFKIGKCFPKMISLVSHFL